MADKTNIKLPFGFVITRSVKPEQKSNRVTPTKKTSLPPGRVSQPENKGKLFDTALKGLNIINPGKEFDYIPVIRSLYKSNEDLGSVLNDLVELTNTGHRIKFDQSVPPKTQDKLRKHLKEKSKNWFVGNPGVHGGVNKIIRQIWVSGALSLENIPLQNLSGIDKVAFINPETIRYSINKKGDYQPWQKVKNTIVKNMDYVKLNPNTFVYYGVGGDEDTPYGVPPFLTALSALATQKDMKDNIDHILNQLGLLGYLEARLDKPDQEAGESNSKYENRLNSLLSETKKNLLNGFKEGVVVGYEGDHEFDFKATTKNLTGVSDLFNLNENQIANGLKTSPAFLGLEAKGGEGQLGIVFTKMLSQLKNVQILLSSYLERLYGLELLMAGYSFSGLEVEFNASTITDDLKLWQGKEIKQRVLRALWEDGIISSDTYAEDMNYQTPFKDVDGTERAKSKDKQDPADKKKREDDKDKSDRKGRDKKNPQPKRKDTDSKPR